MRDHMHFAAECTKTVVSMYASAMFSMIETVRGHHCMDVSASVGDRGQRKEVSPSLSATHAETQLRESTVGVECGTRYTGAAQEGTPQNPSALGAVPGAPPAGAEGFGIPSGISSSTGAAHGKTQLRQSTHGAVEDAKPSGAEGLRIPSGSCSADVDPNQIIPARVARWQRSRSPLPERRGGNPTKVKYEDAIVIQFFWWRLQGCNWKVSNPSVCLMA